MHFFAPVPKITVYFYKSQASQLDSAWVAVEIQLERIEKQRNRLSVVAAPLCRGASRRGGRAPRLQYS